MQVCLRQSRGQGFWDRGLDRFRIERCPAGPPSIFPRDCTPVSSAVACACWLRVRCYEQPTTARASLHLTERESQLSGAGSPTEAEE